MKLSAKDYAKLFMNASREARSGVRKDRRQHFHIYPAYKERLQK